jgi:hypothetical protein
MTEAESLSPITFIPPDAAEPGPQDGMGLCLSGGGFRAMLFHLGAIWRLNQAGMLPQLNRVSSVSGVRYRTLVFKRRVDAWPEVNLTYGEASSDTCWNKKFPK